MLKILLFMSLINQNLFLWKHSNRISQIFFWHVKNRQKITKLSGYKIFIHWHLFICHLEQGIIILIILMINNEYIWDSRKKMKFKTFIENVPNPIFLLLPCVVVSSKFLSRFVLLPNESLVNVKTFWRRTMRSEWFLKTQIEKTMYANSKNSKHGQHV